VTPMIGGRNVTYSDDLIFCNNILNMAQHSGQQCAKFQIYSIWHTFWGSEVPTVKMTVGE